MRKNRMMRLASILLVCVLLTTSVISGTFAKYTSSGTVTSTATVAKWSITVDGNDIAGNTAVPVTTIDLFTTVSDDTTPAGTDDGNVNGTKVIAPGTGGQFILDIVNESQVTAEYTVNFAVSGTATVPLEFKVGEGDWSSTLSNVATTTLPMDNADTDADEGKSTVTVQWRWAFERGTSDSEKTTNNNSDTVLGKTPGTVIVTATINVNQVD